MNPYTVLGVPPDASPAIIKAAWRKLAQRAHPDRAGGDEKRFKEIQLAYDLLSNHQRRATYDATGVDSGGKSLEEEAAEGISAVANWLCDNEPDDGAGIQVGQFFIPQAKTGRLIPEGEYFLHTLRGEISKRIDSMTRDKKKTERDISRTEKKLSTLPAKQTIVFRALSIRAAGLRQRLAGVERALSVGEEMKRMLEGKKAQEKLDANTQAVSS